MLHCMQVMPVTRTASLLQVAFSTHEGKLPTPGASKQQQQQQSDEDEEDSADDEQEGAAAADGPTPLESVMATAEVRRPAAVLCKTAGEPPRGNSCAVMAAGDSEAPEKCHVHVWSPPCYSCCAARANESMSICTSCPTSLVGSD